MSQAEDSTPKFTTTGSLRTRPYSETGSLQQWMSADPEGRPPAQEETGEAGGTDAEGHGHVKAQAETGVTRPQAQGCSPSPPAHPRGHGGPPQPLPWAPGNPVWHC